MFKLFRDSIFAPKKIIMYRSKPWWFILLFILILVVIGGASSVLSGVSYSSPTIAEKLDTIESFKNTDAKITNYNFSSSSNKTLKYGTTSVGFVSNKDNLKEYLSSSSPDYVVVGDSLYYVAYTYFTYSTIIVSKLSDLSTHLESVDLSNLIISSDFFQGVEETIKKYKMPYLFSVGLMTVIDQVLTILSVALICFVLSILFYQAQKYIKKGQLFKMYIFASTLLLIIEDLMMLLGISSDYSFIASLIGFIPYYLLQREFYLRIRLFELTKQAASSDEAASLLKAIQDKMNLKKHDDNDNDNDDDNDDE